MNPGSPTHVLIKGEGIAALTAACVLSGNGITVSIQQEYAAPRPILMLPENTRWLLTDCWKLGNSFWNETYSVFNKRVISVAGRTEQFPYTGYIISQDRVQQTLKELLKSGFPSIEFLSPDA